MPFLTAGLAKCLLQSEAKIAAILMREVNIVIMITRSPVPYGSPRELISTALQTSTHPLWLQPLYDANRVIDLLDKA